MKTLVHFAAIVSSALLCSRTASAQGPLTNGGTHDGAISPIGDADSWTFPALAGDRISVQVAELTGGAAFRPAIEVFAPDGTRLIIDSDALVARADIQAHVNGTSPRSFATSIKPAPARTACDWPRCRARLRFRLATKAGLSSTGPIIKARSILGTWTCGRSRPTQGTGSPCRLPS